MSSHKIFIITFNILRKYFHRSRYYVDWVASRLFHKQTITILKNNSTIKIKDNLCVFSHYDPNNLIDAYVVYYLQKLAHYCNIVFVTTCETLASDEINKINHLCKRIIIKNNRGLDFSAYKHGLCSEKNLSQYQKILFVNDSVYGPFFDVGNIIHYGDKNNLDMWGATDSHMIKYHIQSYFVVFSRSIFLTDKFTKFWNSITNLGLKNNIIIRYEIGMSQYFLQHHFKLGAHSTCPKLDNNRNIDPSHHYWKKSIIENKHPFIKRILIRDNPHNITISNWQSFIKTITDYDISLIEHHLTRTA